MSDTRMIREMTDLPAEAYSALCVITMDFSSKLATAALGLADDLTRISAANELTSHVAGETIASISLVKAVAAVVVNTYPVGSERIGIESAIEELQSLLAGMDKPTDSVSVFLAKKRAEAAAAAGGDQ
jgi:hypothetical protein